MDRQLEQFVRARAGGRCEYCQLPQSARRFRFQIDHVRPRQHGGLTVAENLAVCCGRCNRHKGPNLSGINPDDDATVRLFNPRTDVWPEHFRCDGPALIGISPVGRATAYVLAMNDPDDVATRAELISDGRWPPAN